jgi:hypothetical protein
MNDIDIPILKKTQDLYKVFHDYRKVVPKTERYTIYERCECLIISLLEYFFQAGFEKSTQKVSVLEKASVQLNLLRFFVRLMKDTKTFDAKKYVILQAMIDEIGRMLGGWIRSTRG